MGVPPLEALPPARAVVSTLVPASARPCSREYSRTRFRPPAQALRPAQKVRAGRALGAVVAPSTPTVLHQRTQRVPGHRPLRSAPAWRPGRMRSCLSTGSAPVGLCVRIRHAAYKIQDTTLARRWLARVPASSSACRCDLHEPLRPAGPAQQGMGRMGRGRPGTTRSRSACCPISCGCSARPMWTCFSRRRKGPSVKAPLLIHQNRRRRAWARAASHAWPRGQSARICGDASV